MLKEYIKYFESEDAANGYKIVDVPFISSIMVTGETGGSFVNMRTVEENKQISIVDGQPEIIEYVDDRFRFVSNGDSSVGLEKLSTGQTVEYSIDDGETWTEMTTATTMVELSDGQKMYVKGKLTTGNTYSNYTQFKMTGSILLVGNLNYLWDYDDLDAPLKEYCGRCLFSGCTAITDASQLVLGTSATALANYCYQSMFRGCTSLVSAPELPATTLANGCYVFMFADCASLTTAPELPVTTLAEGCYGFMFVGCTSLTTAPELPATNLAYQCYQNMFARCTLLTTAPELPATTLAYGCYSYMFDACTGLTTAPTLPATTLTGSCYSYMFRGCTNLTTAPTLPATSLAAYCYESMFQGCTNLTTAPSILPATELANSCYLSMFSGCTSLVSAPELPATTLVGYCYRSMFYGCTHLNYIKCLATDISANSCTFNWVSGVSAKGTFVKNANMSSWTTGKSGTPSGWTVQDATN